MTKSFKLPINTPLGKVFVKYKTHSIAVIIFSLFTIFLFSVGFLKSNALLPEQETYKVVGITDGDTITVEQAGVKYKVRYIGIDTPEIAHNSEETDDCYGQEATLRNKQLVDGKVITMIKDKTDKDKYGRLLRYIYVDGKFVNLVLLQEGFSKKLNISPNSMYKDLFAQEEEIAKLSQVGLWGACGI